MSRPDARTVSYTTITLRAASVQLVYHSNAPGYSCWGVLGIFVASERRRIMTFHLAALMLDPTASVWLAGWA